jgi:CRISPR/Cas system-associated exonuclease Cas4 (RecB family)
MTRSEYLSVTSAIGLLLCVKQAWFREQEDLQWLSVPLSEAAALGTVSHQILEEIDAGNFDLLAKEQIEERIFDRWNDLISEQHRKLEVEAKFGNPPKPSRWPFYIVKRNAVVGRALDRREIHESHYVSANPRPQIEESFFSENLGLNGRIDRVEHTSDGVRIVDFKTSTNDSDEISKRFRIQLLLYAALYRDKEHVTPFQAAIEWQDGSRSYINISDNEIDDLLIQVKNLRELLNQESPPGGSPRESVCQFCNYRSICSDFQNQDRTSWSPYPAFVHGSVAEVIQHSDGKSLKVRIIGAHPPWHGSAVVHRILQNIHIEIDATIILDNLNWRGGEGNFDATWKTRFRID